MQSANTNTVFIAFGSNKGDSRKIIASAIEQLENLGNVEKVSPLFITEPEGFKEQPDFLNGVLLLKTALGPGELLKGLKELETKAGRVPTFPDGPRELDLDIIFYNDAVLEEPALTIPHPRAHERDFVLLPLSFIEPDFMHPVIKQTVWQMLRNVICNKSGTLSR